MTGRAASLRALARLVAERFAAERCLQIASSLTFTTLLALVPILTVALTVIGAFPVFRDWVGHLERFVLENMLPESAETVAAYLRRFSASAGRLTALGLALLLLTAMIVLTTIERAFDQIWRMPRPRAPLRRALVYWALLTVGPVLIGASLSLTSWMVSLWLGLVRDIPYATLVLLRIVPFGLTAAAFALLYFALPNRRVAPRDAWSGGLVAAAAFEAMKQGFGAYVAYFPTHQIVYGAFASVPLFLLWIYLSWVVVLVGAVCTAVMPEWRAGTGGAQPLPGGRFLEALNILRVLWQAQREGEIVALERLHGSVRLPLDRIENALEQMAAVGWVARAEEGWVLARAAATLSLGEVYRLFVSAGLAEARARGPRDPLEEVALDLARGIEQRLALPLEELFKRGTAREPQAAAGAPAPQRP